MRRRRILRGSARLPPWRELLVGVVGQGEEGIGEAIVEQAGDPRLLRPFSPRSWRAMIVIFVAPSVGNIREDGKSGKSANAALGEWACL